MSVRVGVEAIAAWAKNDVDLIVCGKEPLGLPRRFEPTHYFLSLPSRSVRSFGSVAKFDCVFALGQCCAILLSKKPKAGTIHDN